MSDNGTGISTEALEHIFEPFYTTKATGDGMGLGLFFARSVTEHLGGQLKFACNIGATHWQADRSAAGLPGPKPEFFFAPGQIQKRAADWGPAELQRKLGEAWSGFRSFSEGWLQVQRGAGREAVERVYEDTLAGRTEPRNGHVLSLWDAA